MTVYMNYSCHAKKYCTIVFCLQIQPSHLASHHLQAKAITIKCFVSHRRPTHFFGKVKKKFHNHL